MKDENCMKEAIFNFAYNEALKDATLMRAFKGEKKYLFKCEEARKTVKDYIDSIIEPDGENLSVKETINTVADQFNNYIKAQCPKNDNERPVFSFGNAQKLINMTAKYIFISGYAKKDEDYQEFRERFKDCHCPMDTRMKNEAVDCFDKLDAEEAKEITDKYPNWKKLLKDTTWSRIDSKDLCAYQCFQDIIKCLAAKEGIIPLEYDFQHWS